MAAAKTAALEASERILNRILKDVSVGGFPRLRSVAGEYTGPSGKAMRQMLKTVGSVSPQEARVLAGFSAIPQNLYDEGYSYLVSGTQRLPFEAVRSQIGKQLKSQWAPKAEYPAAEIGLATNAARLVTENPEGIAPELLQRATKPVRALNIYRRMSPEQREAFDLIAQSKQGPRSAYALANVPGLDATDLLAARRLARSPQDVREIAMTLIADGMSPSEAIAAASVL